MKKNKYHILKVDIREFESEYDYLQNKYNFGLTETYKNSIINIVEKISFISRKNILPQNIKYFQALCKVDINKNFEFIK